MWFWLPYYCYLGNALDSWCHVRMKKADCSDRQPELYVFGLLWFGFWEVENEIWQGWSSWPYRKTHGWSFLTIKFLPLLGKLLFFSLIFFINFDPPWCTNFKKKKADLEFFRTVILHKPAKKTLSNSQKPKWTSDSREDEVVYSSLSTVSPCPEKFNLTVYNHINTQTHCILGACPFWLMLRV